MQGSCCSLIHSFNLILIRVECWNKNRIHFFIIRLFSGKILRLPIIMFVLLTTAFFLVFFTFRTVVKLLMGVIHIGWLLLV